MNRPGLRRFDWTRLDAAGRRAALGRPALRPFAEIRETVSAIVSDVRREGDAALLRLTEQLDGVRLDALEVTAGEISEARRMLPSEALHAIDRAIDNITRFHAAQASVAVRLETVPGVVCERVVRPIRSVGLYVPAGSAPLPSTAVMLAVPARLAANPVRVLCTPPRRDGRADPAVVHVANACGVSRIFKIGGAQAVGAMAYGTATVPKVDKIFGPGNAWVTAAKQVVAADAGGAALDMPAGPSEVMVVADATARPRYVALDLLSQAEHGPDSQVILVTTEASLASEVEREIDLALPTLPRCAVIASALAHAAVVFVRDEPEAIDVANHYAPEHLILHVESPRQMVEQIDSAGSVFLGPWTPESVGDYCSGTNHVLPTYGYARAYSGLSVADFQRRMTLQELTPQGLAALAPTVAALAALEGLQAHAAAVNVRLDAG